MAMSGCRHKSNKQSTLRTNIRVQRDDVTDAHHALNKCRIPGLPDWTYLEKKMKDDTENEVLYHGNLTSQYFAKGVTAAQGK